MIDDLDISLSNQYHKIEDKKRQLLKGHKAPVSDISVSSYRSISPMISPKSIKPTIKNNNIQQYLKQIQVLSSENQRLVFQTNELQNYVQQLVSYINDSSSKYSDNIQKYGISYKELYIKYTNLQQSSDQQILLLKNELQNQRQISYKKQQQVNDLTKLTKNLKQQIQLQYEKSKRIKAEAQQQWQQHQNNKTLWNNILNGVQQQTKGYKQQIFDLNNTLKSKEININEHEEQIKKLKVQLEKRLELPQKIVNKQKQIATRDVDIKHDKQKIQQLNRTLDLLKLQLNRSEKQRQQLRVKNTELSGDFESYFKLKSKKLEDDWRQKQFNYELQVTKLKQNLELIKQQLNKELINVGQLKEELNQKQRQITYLNKQIKNEITQKQSYLDEFKILKNNYQDAISNLENTIQQQQHKLWGISQRNKQLEFEVDKFRDVTQQLEYLNNNAKGKTQIFRDEVEMKGLGDPVRLLRGEQDKKQAQKAVQSKVKSFKESRRSQQQSDDPWATLMGKINSL